MTMNDTEMIMRKNNKAWSKRGFRSWDNLPTWPTYLAYRSFNSKHHCVDADRWVWGVWSGVGLIQYVCGLIYNITIKKI